MSLTDRIKQMNVETCGLHYITDHEHDGIKNIFVEMLSWIDEICTSNGIQWGLIGGSALGAVRHHGLIPWDDDIDITMTRSDFMKFVEVFPKNNDRNYILMQPGDQGYYSSVVKVFNENTTFKYIQTTGKGKGLFVDIFVLDNTYDNWIKRTFHGLRCTFYLFVISVMVFHMQKDELKKYVTPDVYKQVLLRDRLSVFFRFKPVEWWLFRGVQCFSKVKNEKSKYVVSATGRAHYFGEIYERDWMCNFIRMPFEGKMFPVMKGYDYFLSKLYGADYMKLPPESKREKHACIELNLDS